MIDKQRHGEIGLILVFLGIFLDTMNINIPIWISMIINVTAIFLLASALKQIWNANRD